MLCQFVEMNNRYTMQSLFSGCRSFLRSIARSDYKPINMVIFHWNLLKLRRSSSHGFFARSWNVVFCKTPFNSFRNPIGNLSKDNSFRTSSFMKILNLKNVFQPHKNFKMIAWKSFGFLVLILRKLYTKILFALQSICYT